LCANTGARLHLIHPLGFSVDDRQLRRAGLDYHEMAVINEHPTLDEFLGSVAPKRLFAFSTRGRQAYHEVRYAPGDALLFGPESRGLPQSLIDAQPPDRVVRIPMLPERRSINLSNAVAVAVYEAWRQCGFDGST
jgi:tRNA (cytidine/uridine-2'-O-)-methyltransferase